MDRPKLLIIIGFILVLFGVAGPFLIILGVWQSTFALNFLSYAASVGGLFMGIIGAAWYTRLYRGQDK